MFSYNPDTDGSDIKDLLGKLYKDINFDKKLYKKLYQFSLAWGRKGPEYIQFLGGNSLGEHPVRFSARDDDLLMTDIYNVDIGAVATNILRLDTKKPDSPIQSSWNVSTNPVLQTLCYTMHRFITDGKMGNQLDDAITVCYRIFAYKVFGSLLSKYFRYNASPAVAKAAYERLSNRYLIKKLGTWGELIDYRAKSVIPPKGLHAERIQSYTTIDSVRILNDLHGGIREHVKAIWNVINEISISGDNIRSTSILESNEEGGDSTRDIIDRPDKYMLRLRELLGSQTNLIDGDLVYLISQFVKASDPDIIKVSLANITESYDPRSSDNKIFDTIILKTIAYCNTKGVCSDYRKNITEIISYMRGYWSSGSVTDKDVIAAKKHITKIVKASTPRKTKWVIAANVQAVIVYLFVRSIK